jgi:hypothetical protein
MEDPPAPSAPHAHSRLTSQQGPCSSYAQLCADGSQAAAVHVGVNLRGAQVRVPQHHLHGPQVRSRPPPGASQRRGAACEGSPACRPGLQLARASSPASPSIRRIEGLLRERAGAEGPRRAADGSRPSSAPGRSTSGAAPGGTRRPRTPSQEVRGRGSSGWGGVSLNTTRPGVALAPGPGAHLPWAGPEAHAKCSTATIKQPSLGMSMPDPGAKRMPGRSRLQTSRNHGESPGTTGGV